MLFDVNCHLGAWPFAQVPEMTARELVRHLARSGIRRAAVSHFNAVFQPDPMSANRLLFAATRGERTLVPLPTVNLRIANWREQLTECAADPRVRAVRLVSNYHGYKLTARALAPFGEELTARGLRLVITARMEDERHRYFALGVKGVPVAELAGYLQRFPRMAPLITGLSVGEALKLAGDRANFSADLAYQENIALAAMLRGKLPSSRLMFGTFTPLVSARAQAGKLSAPGFSHAERHRIGFANAHRFFTQPPCPL